MSCNGLSIDEISSFSLGRFDSHLQLVRLQVWIADVESLPEPLNASVECLDFFWSRLICQFFHALRETFLDFAGHPINPLRRQQLLPNRIQDLRLSYVSTDTDIVGARTTNIA
jgi:hypothetical protein